VTLYRDQTRDAKALSSLNQLVQPSNSRWLEAASGRTTLHGADGAREARTAVIAGGNERLAVVQWFWVDGRMTARPLAVMLYQTLAVLRGRSDAVAWVILYTPLERGEQAASETLAAFAQAIGRPLESTLARAAEAR
jgi:EpsI family protein